MKMKNNLKTKQKKKKKKRNRTNDRKTYINPPISGWALENKVYILLFFRLKNSNEGQGKLKLG